MGDFFLNFSLEFLSKIFFFCLHFVFRIDEATEGIFLVTFFSHFFFFAKDQILFFLSKKKELFNFFFFSWYQAAVVCFNEFFSFETPKKQKKKYVKRCLERKNKTRQVTMDMSRQVSTCSDKLRHVGNNTVQCSSVLVLEVVFDGLGQVQFGDFALLNALFINGLTYNAATQIHQGQRFRVKSA